jgi:hypothetical protein
MPTKNIFFCLLLTYCRYIYIGLQRQQVIKEVKKQLKLRYFLVFCLLMEGFGSRSVQIITDIGGPKTYGSRTLDRVGYL